MKKPFPLNPVEKAVLIQPSRESRPHSTHLRKPSAFNPVEKAVPIQPIWESRPHSTHMRKPSPLNPLKKAVPIQPIWESRPHLTHLKKPSPFNSVEKAVRSFSCVDHPAAMTTQLRWPELTQNCTRWAWLLIKWEFPGGVFKCFLKLKLTSRSLLLNSDSLSLKLPFATL